MPVDYAMPLCCRQFDATLIVACRADAAYHQLRYMPLRDDATLMLPPSA